MSRWSWRFSSGGTNSSSALGSFLALRVMVASEAMEERGIEEGGMEEEGGTEEEGMEETRVEDTAGEDEEGVTIKPEEAGWRG